MPKIKNDKDRMLQATPIEERANIKYASPKDLVQYSIDKGIIEELINEIKAKPNNKIKNQDVIQIANKVESFLEISRACYASSVFYTNDFQWIQDSLNDIDALKNLKNRLLLSSRLSPLIIRKRYTEARRQLEEIETGISIADMKTFECIAVAFLESSKIINGESDNYFNDFWLVEEARKTFMLSQNKTRPRKNNSTQSANKKKNKSSNSGNPRKTTLFVKRVREALINQNPDKKITYHEVKKEIKANHEKYYEDDIFEVRIFDDFFEVENMNRITRTVQWTDLPSVITRSKKLPINQ